MQVPEVASTFWAKLTGLEFNLYFLFSNEVLLFPLFGVCELMLVMLNMLDKI
ncbi:MAG: hypothetical protein BMS9Abin34_494 [Patescibacteria group bacterium]|nr:MAG: hypothetical protein BMS9Abin34_494 [Patescibacteria group bacterium]